MDPRLSGQNCKFLKFLLSFNSQKRLGYKENNTKYRSLSRKPRSHVRILIYRTWPIDKSVLNNSSATEIICCCRGCLYSIVNITLHSVLLCLIIEPNLRPLKEGGRVKQTVFNFQKGLHKDSLMMSGLLLQCVKPRLCSQDCHNRDSLCSVANLGIWFHQQSSVSRVQ